VADLPIALSPELSERLSRVIDTEGKIAAALDALGPIRGRDVAVVDTKGGPIVERVRATSATIAGLPLNPDAWVDWPEAGFDVMVGMWSSFRGVDRAELAAADRLLRPGGRLLAIHDYGRDDVARLRGDLPEYGDWTRRTGPFLTGGFRIRVLHCFWTFDTLEETREFLAAAFGDPGTALGSGLKRPRLAWNVAVYHRSRPAGEQP